MNIREILRQDPSLESKRKENHRKAIKRVCSTRSFHYPKGCGLNERGRSDHHKASKWKIQSPIGEVFEFCNLMEWVRNNVSRFDNRDPSARTKLEDRVVSGIEMAVWKRPHYQYWVVLSHEPVHK